MLTHSGSEDLEGAEKRKGELDITRRPLRLGSRENTHDNILEHTAVFRSQFKMEEKNLEQLLTTLNRKDYIVALTLP